MENLGPGSSLMPNFCPQKATFTQFSLVQGVQLKDNATTAQVEGQSGTSLRSSPMAAGVPTVLDMLTVEENHQAF